MLYKKVNILKDFAYIFFFKDIISKYKILLGFISNKNMKVTSNF